MYGTGEGKIAVYCTEDFCPRGLFLTGLCLNYLAALVRGNWHNNPWKRFESTVFVHRLILKSLVHTVDALCRVFPICLLAVLGINQG